MTSILNTEHPQLVVLNGDLITGEATNRSNSSAYVDRIIAPLIDQDVPWASTYGNHESASSLCPRDVFQRERESEHGNSLTQRMVSDSKAGYTNYFLPVFPQNESEVPGVILWFFDTRGGTSCPDAEGSGTRPDWVDRSVSFCFCIIYNFLNRFDKGN